MLDDLYFTNESRGASSPKVLSQPNGTTAGGVYMAKLGDYMFSLDTAAFQQLQRDTAFRWTSQPRIGRRPAMQFTGLEDETIELSGVIYPHFRGGIRQIGQMRAAGATGKAMPLVYAFDQIGQYCGQWCIKSVREGRTEFNRNGTPKKIEFSLSLVYYGEDAGQSANAVVSLVSSVASGFAAATAVPVPALIGQAGNSMLTSATAVQNLASITADSPLADINTVASTVSGLARSAGQIASAARSTISSAVGTVAAGVIQLIPADARTAASELMKTADVILSVQRDVEATIAVVKDSPANVRRTSKDLDAAMKEALRSAVLNGGTTKSAAVRLAAQEHSAEVSDVDRMVAGASMSNITRAADDLIFACSEASRQANIIVDKIDV